MRMRRTASDRKRQIIAAAIALSDRVGPDRLTTQMIAKEVGLSQPGVFRHFPKKDLIWQAVARHLGDEMAQVWQEAAKSQNPVERIRNIVAAHLRLIELTPALPGILFSRELHIENPTLRKAFFRTMNGFLELLRQTIEEAIATGQFKKDLPAADAAFLIIGLIQSLAMRWSLSGRSFNLHEQGEKLLALQLAGFSPGNNG